MSYIEIDIAELAQRAGLSNATLRYYEEKGLISPIGRKGLRRQYSSKSLDQLALIRLAQSASFTLEEIKSIFFQKRQIHIQRPVLESKIISIEQRIAEMQLTLNSLKHIAQCPYEQHLDCPEFQNILKQSRT